MYARIFLCCAVLCRLRPYDGLIPSPRSPTKVSARTYSLRNYFEWEQDGGPNP
jgi:hypothetical protein